MEGHPSAVLSAGRHTANRLLTCGGGPAVLLGARHPALNTPSTSLLPLGRACVQCGRFHELPEFEQGMRSCKKQLARHAERRRQGRERAAAARAAARAAQATGGAAPVPALAGSSRDTEGTGGWQACTPRAARRVPLLPAHAWRRSTRQQRYAPETSVVIFGLRPPPCADSLPMAAPTATAETVSLRAADLQGVALAIAKPEQEQEQEAVQRQQEEQQAAESFEQPAGGAGRSGSGASTVLQLPAASQSAGGLSAFLSAAAAEEAAEAAAAEEETDGTEGRRQRRRKQPRLAVEPDVTWFAPQLPVPPALTASPPISGLLGVDAASALNTTTLEQLSGIVWPTQARAAAAAAGLPGGLPQAPLASTLAALLQGAVPVVAPTPPLGLQQLLLPQHAAVLSLLLLQQQQQQQQQQRLDAFALLQQQQQQQQQRLDAFALLQQQELLRNLRTLVAPRPAVPTPPLPLQAVQQSAALDQQREQHVAVLFQAAVESLLGGLLGRPPGFP